MIGTRGRLKGVSMTPRQFANDWISATTADGRPVIVNPLSVTLDGDDIRWFIARAGDGHAGFFWNRYVVVGDTFARLAPAGKVTITRAGGGF